MAEFQEPLQEGMSSVLGLIVVYADFECILEKTDASSHMCQHHRVFSIGYYVYCSYDDSLSMYRFRCNNDCIVWFTKQLRNLAHRVNCILAANVPMVDFDYEKFNSTLSYV